MPAKGVRDDIEEADDEESYYKWLEENPNAGRSESCFLETFCWFSPDIFFFCFPWGSPEPQSFGPNFAFFREALAIL